MATDKVAIWNQAISACGSKSSISTDDENSKAANLCRQWYPTVLDAVLKAGDWPSARKYVTLALKAERNFNNTWTDTDPAPGWKYAYAQPADLLAPRHLTTYARFDRAWLTDANTIVTNQEQAVLCYMFRQEDVTKWDNGLERAVILGLGAAICLALTGTRTWADRLETQATEALLLGQTESANETDFTQEPLAEWFAARDYEEGPRSTKFVWPYEELNLVAT